MRYLVKGLREIHDEHIGLLVTMIQSAIQIDNHVMVEWDQFTYFGNHADDTETLIRVQPLQVACHILKLTDDVLTMLHYGTTNLSAFLEIK